MTYNISILTDSAHTGFSGFVLGLNELSNGLLGIALIILIYIVIFFGVLNHGYKFHQGLAAASFVTLLVTVIFRIWGMTESYVIITMAVILAMSIAFAIMGKKS